MRYLGYRIVHWRPGRAKANSWAVPVTYDGKGWPDLVGFHAPSGTIVAIERKSARGHVTPEQTDWLVEPHEHSNSGESLGTQTEYHVIAEWTASGNVVHSKLFHLDDEPGATFTARDRPRSLVRFMSFMRVGIGCLLPVIR